MVTIQLHQTLVNYPAVNVMW